MKSAKKLSKATSKSRAKKAKPAARKTARRKSAVRAPGPTSPGTPFIGQVAPFAFGYAPAGWVPCDGRLMPINGNQALFSLLGTTYGGDGRMSFALPRLTPVGPQGPGYFIAILGAYPMR